MEQLPVVADVLAKSMGVTRGELRYLAFQSKVTTEVMIRAFEEARAELEEKFGRRIPTLSEGWSVLSSAVLKYVGETDQAVGITRTLAAGMQTAARNANVLGPALFGVGSALVTLVLPFGKLKSLLALAGTNWLAAIIVGAAAATIVLIAHWNDFRILIAKAQDGLTSLGVPIDDFIAKVDKFLAKWGKIPSVIQNYTFAGQVGKTLGGNPATGTLGENTPAQDEFWRQRRSAMATGQPLAAVSVAQAGMGPHEQAVRAAIAAEQAAGKIKEVLEKAWQPTVEQQAWFAQLQKPLDEYMNRLEAVEGFTEAAVKGQETLTTAFLNGGITMQVYQQGMDDAEVQLRILKDATVEMVKATDDNAEANRQCYVDGLKSLQEYQRASAELWLKQTQDMTDYSTGMKRGFAELWLEATDDASMMADAVKNAFHGMEDMVVDFVTKGKVDFKGFVDSVLADLTRMLFRKMIMAPLMEAMGIPGMASGGSPTVNQPVWVGEQGPEIFTPSQAGTITPAPQSATQSQANVTVINVGSMEEALAAMRSKEGQRIIVNSRGSSK
jgi:hypothetical protein